MKLNLAIPSWQILCILPCSLFILSSYGFHLGLLMQVKASPYWKLHCLLERGRTVQSLSADTPFSVVPNSFRPKEEGQEAMVPLLWSQTLVIREKTKQSSLKKKIPPKEVLVIEDSYLLLAGPSSTFWSVFSCSSTIRALFVLKNAAHPLCKSSQIWHLRPGWLADISRSSLTYTSSHPQGFSQLKVTWSVPLCILSR